MSEPGALSQAFRTAWRRPALAAAESLWRWLYLLGCAGIVLLAADGALQSTGIGLSGLATGTAFQSAMAARLLAQAVPNMFRDGVIAIIAIAGLWVGIASVSRTAIFLSLVQADCAHADVGLSSWFEIGGLCLLRVLLALVAIGAGIGMVMVWAAAIPVSGFKEQNSAALALWLALFLLVWLAWCFVDWFLAVAPIFSVQHGQGTLGSIAAAADLFHNAPAACFSIWAMFAFCRIALLLVVGALLAISVVMTAPNWGSTSAACLAILLAYSVVASWFSVVRFAAYAHLAARSSPSVVTGPPSPLS